MADPRSTQQALDVSPPTAGAINQLTMVAATPSAAQDTGVTNAPDAPPQYFSFLSPVEFYIVFGPTNGVANPVVGANSAWGPLAASVTHDFRVDVGRRYFKVISTPGGSLVWRPSSGPGVV